MTAASENGARRAWQRFERSRGGLLVVVALLAIANVIAVALNLHPIIRTPLAIPLVLFLPGYALARALLPAGALSRVELFVVSVALSIAVSIVGGLLLGLTPNGLNPLSWTLLLSLVAIAGALGASLRAPRAPGEARRWPAVRRAEAGVLIAATIAVAAILTGTSVIASQLVSPPPAALWMLAVDGQPTQARLGMRAGSPGGQYVIKLASSGVQIGEYTLNLGAGEQWETIVTFDPAARAAPIVARLYEPPSEVDLRFVILAPLAPGGT
jgi:hypothetical protein